MEPTNPIFSKFDQVLGKTTPTLNTPQPPKWGDELRSMATSPASKPSNPDLADFSAEAIQGGASKIGSAISGAAKDYQAGQQDPGSFSGVMKSTGGLLKGGLGVASGFLQTLLSPLEASVNYVGDKAGNVPLLQHLATSGFGDAIAKGEQGVNDWAKAHPTLMDALNVGLASLGGNEKIGLPDAGTLKNDLGNIKTGITDTLGKVKDTTLGAADAVKSKLGDTIQGKPEADILATPKEQVYKLSPPERKLWFDNETNKINTEADTTTNKIKADLKTKADATTATTEKLQKDLAIASRDKVIELRPKIVKAMGEQSKIYRSLIDEEMAGKENIPVKIDDLKTHIDSRYGDNPALATAIKEKLGLTETPEVLKKGQLPTIQAEAPTKTLGELYNQTKSLKQDISTGATKGSKVFSSTDKLTDDAIHTLTDFMKKNGVDFKEANQFWSKYAPIRDQLVSESKPFLQTGTKTKTFAGTLKRVAEGTDVNNENFISETEKLVGEPITKEAKGIVSKLDATEKANIANKIEAETKIEEAKMAKDKSLEKLSSQQFEVERQARVRNIIKKTVIGALGLLGAKELGITKFFGL